MSISLTTEQIDRIIEMAWEDRTPFEAIRFQFGISEMETKELMRDQLQYSSYKLWRKRVTNRKTKHQKLRNFSEDRFKCKQQRQISNNKISKR
ncbi:TIGR03643 family protein [Flavobacterium sp. J27]|uniref:TIGR03643 family protein n=1 Tax=Flavobacterium sp. J27 TaxID=2060419 RepID=UPI0010305D50|nr:TIGR03643 family protein [Flavobacterium sp. J27]